MMEVYEPQIDLSRLAGTLDILPGENEPALLSAPLRVAAGPSSEIGVLEGVVDTAALPPGRYLARATVRQEGAPRGQLLRPFRIARRADGEVAPGAVASASSVASLSPPAALADALTAAGPEVADALGAPEVIGAVLAHAEAARPAARAAFAAARAGRIGSAAVDALAAGDQAVAAFLRGLELFLAGRYDGALTQLQLAMQQAPSFAPARLYLGAALAASGRHREAAGLLQSVEPAVAGTAGVARMAALSWLRAGNAESAIASLEQSGAAEDPSSARTLAFAYVAARRYADALPLLARYLDAHPGDAAALLAGVYATFAAHSPSPHVESLSSDLERAEKWARTYATAKGEHLPLVEAWIKYLRDAR
jgi:tetratricopeptide (TPR) repeat protein